MAKQTIKLTESKLRTIVEDCVRETLGEALMGNVRSKIKDGINAIGNKINDFAPLSSYPIILCGAVSGFNSTSYQYSLG